ncbi:cytochrome P450 [Trametes elegans]|nr:cytochrome P450 [Trametes elegans]
MLTYMLEDPEMSGAKFRDNMVVFFIAGHDTTASAMSSLVFYFAKHPEMQCAAVGSAKPTIHNMRDTPFVQACIREALRINTPIVYMFPRAGSRPAELVSALGKRYVHPANTSVIHNICANHHNPFTWPRYFGPFSLAINPPVAHLASPSHEPASFNPERFMNKNDKEIASVDASLWMCVHVQPFVPHLP